MNSIEHEIRNNLYEFYDHITQITGIHSENQDHWSMIQNAPGAWPRITYRIAPEIVRQDSSSNFSARVKSGAYPEILIAGDENIREVDPFLRSQGFYPFSAWKGMATTRTAIPEPDLPESVEVVKVESAADIEQWIKVVTSQLIAPARLDKILVESLIAQTCFEAFLLKYNGTGVSTILVFKTGHSTGLYLIATEKSAQRQGFARLLVQHILFHETRKSNNPIVLHATPKGEALYSSLGFLPYNQFFLYRILNINQ